jgi:iron complex outermembrane recepter protein
MNQVREDDMGECRVKEKGVSASGRTRIGLMAATALGAVIALPATAYAQDEIVVTAQFREQNLQETPLAITAVAGDELINRGITDTQDLAKIAPSVNFRSTGPYGGKTMGAFIRGVGASDYNFNIEPGVAFYIDDVYLGPSFGLMLKLVDLERAEILRGPQGTLNGKNAIGGAVRLVSAKPKGDGSGYLIAETGSRDLLRFKGAFDVGLAEDLAMRVSAFSESQDGIVQLYDFGCLNPDLVGDTSAPHSIQNQQPAQSCKRGTLGNSRVAGARLQFRWTPSDTFEANLSGNFIDDNSGGAADVILEIDPAGFANYMPPGFTTPFFETVYGVPYDERFLPPNNYSSYATFEDPYYGLDFEPQATMLTKDATLTMDWELSPSIAIQSISAWRSIAGTWSYDSDSSPLATDGVIDTQKHEQFSQELRIIGDAFDNRVHWTVGGFYYDATQRDIGTIQAVPFNFAIQVDSYPEHQNYAGFAHLEFDLTDQLTLIGGIRQTSEDKVYRFIENDIPGTPSNVFPGGLDVPAETSYNRTDWRAGIQYQLNDDHMVYFNVSTGFRGGGFNPRPSNLQTVVPFGPEEVTSYEAGIRSEFFDNRVRWNNTGYYAQYEGIQLNGRITSIVSGGEFPVTVVTNAAKARIYGIESELEADVNDSVFLYGSLSYTDFKYQDLGPAAALAATNGPTLDSTQRFTPKWQFNAGFNATLPFFTEYGTLRLNADYAYQTEQYPDARNLEALKIDAYGVANARLTFIDKNEDWEFSVIGLNIFDERYFYQKNYVSGNFQMKGVPAPGAQWGISLRRNF